MNLALAVDERLDALAGVHRRDAMDLICEKCEGQRKRRHVRDGGRVSVSFMLHPRFNLPYRR